MSALQYLCHEVGIDYLSLMRCEMLRSDCGYSLTTTAAALRETLDHSVRKPAPTISHPIRNRYKNTGGRG